MNNMAELVNRRVVFEIEYPDADLQDFSAMN